MAPLAWRICDLTGATLASVANRLTDKVTIGLCDQRTATLKISTDEPAAAVVAPLSRLLKATYGGQPVFCGIVTDPVYDGAARTLEIPAVDVTQRLAVSQIEPPAVLGSPYALSLPNTDQSQIMWSLIQAARPTGGELASGVPDLGVAQGALPATVWRDRFYEPGQNIWDAVVELSQVQGGVDFDFTPADRTDGVLATFNTFTRMGVDRSAGVAFHFNWGADNLENLVYKPAGSSVVNRSIYIGQAENGQQPPYARSDQADSEKAYGLIRQTQGRPDISDVATLQQNARGDASVLAYPPDFFEVTPAVEGLGGIDPQTGQRRRINPQTGGRYGVPPLCAPDGDYWLGDTIAATGVLDSSGELRVTLRGRVTQIELASDKQAGDVRVTLQCAPELPSYPVS